MMGREAAKKEMWGEQVDHFGQKIIQINEKVYLFEFEMKGESCI